MKGENMKKKIDIKSLVLGALFGSIVVFSLAAAPAANTWEYRWITPDRKSFEAEINKAAGAGWELVSAVPDPDSGHMSAVLKRARKAQ
jgi:hypothetical protein